MRHIYSDVDNWATINVVDLRWANPLYGYMIMGVEVQRRFRGRGVARRLMQQVLEDADREDAPLYLAIVPDPPITGPQRPLTFTELEAWYRRCGFTLYFPDAQKGENNLYWRPRASERQQDRQAQEEGQRRLADPGQADSNGGALPSDPDPRSDARLPGERDRADAR